MNLTGRIDRLRSEWNARLEVDVPGMVAGVRARLTSRLALVPLSIDSDLVEHRGRFGVGRARVWAFESPELRKAVLTHVELRPLIEGLALTLLPRRDRRAPLFACDLMVLPMRIATNADVYGSRELTRGVLEPMAPAFQRLDGGAGPAWTAAIGSGAGLHAKASARVVDELFAALTGALGRYLDALSAAPCGGDAGSDHEAFFAAFHGHGPRTGAMARLFGSAWAERFSRLAFE